MVELKAIENGMMYDGKKITVEHKKNKYVINADGRKIKCNEDEFILMYVYFSIMFKSLSNDNNKDALEKISKKEASIYDFL